MPFFFGKKFNSIFWQMQFKNCIWIWSFFQSSYWAHQTTQDLTTYSQPSSPKTIFKQSPTQPTPRTQKQVCCSWAPVTKYKTLFTQWPLQSIFLTKRFYTVPVWRAAFPLSHTDLLERQTALQRAAHLVPDLLGVKCHSDLYLQGLWHQCCTPT